MAADEIDEIAALVATRFQTYTTAGFPPAFVAGADVREVVAMIRNEVIRRAQQRLGAMFTRETAPQTGGDDGR